MPSPSSKNAEYTAKSLEEALDAAALEFRVPVGDLSYEILEDKTRSILGFVRTGEMRVRIWLEEEEADEQPVEAPEPATVAVEAPEEPAVEDEPAPDVAEDEDPKEEQEPEDPRVRERNPVELEELALDVVSTLLDKMGVLAAAEIADPGGKVDDQGDVSPMVINIVGDDLGQLIGSRGAVLRDLQFIVRLLISRKLRVWPNLVVDVEGYKERRIEKLRGLAQRMADQARESGRPVTLEPMPANERRIIHLALRDDPDVYTESVGSEDRRKVQILLKR